MKLKLCTKILKVKGYLYPDNINTRSILILMGILLFWYTTCVISGLTESRYIYISSLFLNYIGVKSKIAAIYIEQLRQIMNDKTTINSIENLEENIVNSYNDRFSKANIR